MLTRREDQDQDQDQDDKITLTGSGLQHHLLLLSQPARSLLNFCGIHLEEG